MDRGLFRENTSRKVFILDGATGTELQKRGMPAGVCPELWAIENPRALSEIQEAYAEAGSDIIYTCTFGGNRVKLDEFGLGDRTIEMNKRLAEISRQAAGGKCLVAGDLASTGRFLRPLGDMAFEECVNVYKEQVKGLLEGGVDLFVIETMLDIQEARAALIAVKESCGLPVCVSMSFDESKRTLTGTDPVTALITLQSLGADAVGCNCSTGPELMLEIISMMKPYARIPLMAKPNAGLPRLVDGSTVFDMGAEEFGTYAEDFIRAGASLLGGCCGTSPEYIKELRQKCSGLKPMPVDCKPYSALTSSTKTAFLGAGLPVAVVGERINPTGKKKLKEELKQGLTGEVRRLAAEQIENGAHVLDVNVGMPGIDEKETMVKLIELLTGTAGLPLCLDSSSPEVLEAALRIYPGRALVNSISLEKVKLERLLPVAAKYGAMFILLPLSDDGVPEGCEERCGIVERVFREAVRYGCRKEDIVVDGLVMTVSSNQQAAMETLKVIEWCSRDFGCATIVGLSNVSFGLPERSWINTAFLAMAIDRGLTMTIANPSSEVLMSVKMACDVLTMRDVNSMSYISHFTSRTTDVPLREAEKDERPLERRIYDAVLKGNKEGTVELVNAAVQQDMPASGIVNGCLIPAINEVGILFDQKKYFLPQLIQSAEAMKAGFDCVEPLLVQSGGGDAAGGTAVVLATVKGDIHDIGKNIVGLMLKNYGFKIYDLGKDVSAQRIIFEAKRTGAKIIGLSALMTTTMVEMKEVIRLAREERLDCRFMIGGAVVDESYAREIGADGYSKDAYDAVKLAKRLAQQ